MGADKLVIVGFPCNQFLQERKSAASIKAFAAGKGFTAPGMILMDKVRVNGSKAHPVYLYLKKMTNPKHNVSWNFGSYFLVDPKGQVTLHPGTSPDELAPSVKRVIQETQPPSSS